MGTLVGNKPPDTLEEWRVSRESPRAAVMAKDPQRCVHRVCLLTESQPWDSMVSATARPSQKLWPLQGPHPRTGRKVTGREGNRKRSRSKGQGSRVRQGTGQGHPLTFPGLSLEEMSSGVYKAFEHKMLQYNRTVPFTVTYRIYM